MELLDPAPVPVAAGSPQRALIVAGLSGGGKTTALKALEDFGYDTVDHVPLALLGRLLTGAGNEAAEVTSPMAIGVGVRTRDFSAEGLARFVESNRRRSQGGLTLVFLDCDDEELRRRYTVTRRQHPLAENQPVLAAIAQERIILAPVRAVADLAVDTTDLTPQELKQILAGYFDPTPESSLRLRIMSFAYRNNLPREADLVFDVRFLANPFYDPRLKGLTGLHRAVADHVAADPMFDAFFDSLMRLLDPLIPRYATEGKSYLTIAVGCTGGRHRSVFVAERLAVALRREGRQVDVYHRDLVRSGATPEPSGIMAGPSQ